MRLWSLPCATACMILVAAGLAQASDLDGVGRPPVKEPAYQGKAPKYALLVLGPQARTRVWLVLDGSTLYVDRNGNGDLTEDGEKIPGKKEKLGDSDHTIFAIGELREGGRQYLNGTLTVTEGKLAGGQRRLDYRLLMEVEMPGRHGLEEGGSITQLAGPGDSSGELQFADRPQDAPVLHFGGAWTITLDSRPTFRINRELELYLVLGTPGRGKGTLVCTGYGGLVPRDAYPRAEITFPPRRPGDAPVTAVYELKGRC